MYYVLVLLGVFSIFCNTKFIDDTHVQHQEITKVVSLHSRHQTGVGDREEGKKGGGLGRESFRAFLPPPPPPLFAPATQATKLLRYKTVKVVVKSSSFERDILLQSKWSDY